jgi:hypothetical protein
MQGTECPPTCPHVSINQGATESDATESDAAKKELLICAASVESAAQTQAFIDLAVYVCPFRTWRWVHDYDTNIVVRTRSLSSLRVLSSTLDFSLLKDFCCEETKKNQVEA